MSISAPPISQAKPSAGCSHRLFIPFGSIFVLVGAGLLWVMLIQPVLNVWRASRWPAADCRIIRSAMQEHDGDDGSTWSPDIEYEYVVGGQSHRSRRVMFFEASTSGRRWIEQLLADYPAGATRTCYYDPRKTDEAVLRRGYSWFLLLGLLPLLFLGAGVLMVWIGCRSPGRKATAPKPGNIVSAAASPTSLKPGAGPAVPKTAFASTAESQEEAEDDDDAEDIDDDDESDDMDDGSEPWTEWEGPRKLAPESSLVGRVIGLGIFALFWNGIVAVVFWNVLGNGLLTIGGLFFGVFGLVGLGLLVGFLHQLLSLFNPVVEIALENGAVAAGEELVLAWETRGSTARLRELVIELVAREKATYTRGTSTSTDTHEIARLRAFSTADQPAMRFGSVSLPIPAGAIHSFVGARNQIEWAIEIRGRIPFWPDVAERFPFFVKPLGC
jgi:Protein of unknown function (DUF3592)